VGGVENKIWTLMLNTDRQEKTPLVLLHGFASGVALWCLNLDSLAKERPIYAIDLLGKILKYFISNQFLNTIKCFPIGFGSSSRPNFSNNALEAESQMVSSIEEWRKQIGLEKFVLLGHR
jgi:pimeloyl-ACP methyl ester carboxylesterase